MGVNHDFAQELREFAIELVDVAGRASLPYFRQALTVENKSATGFDPVTVADRATEDALRQLIAVRYPEHGIQGEERASVNPKADYQWVIDPIDGTKAFVCGLPTWSNLIGLCLDEAPIFGLMNQPFVGEYFVGGFDAACNVRGEDQQILTTSARIELEEATLFATAPDMFDSEEVSCFARLSNAVRLTRFGVDSYAYCLLASGYIDVVAEAGLGFYDIAALIPIIECAGGVVSDWHGATVRNGGTVLAAANRKLHEAALAALQ